MDRNLIISEYAQLRVYLNRSNRLANEKTNLGFYISLIDKVEYRLFAFVKSGVEEHRVALAARNRFRNWERSGFTPFVNLENFCADILNTKEVSIKSNARPLITEEQSKSLTQLIQDTFNNLSFD